MIEQTKGINDAPDSADGLFLRDLGVELLTTPDVAGMLDVPVTRVMDLLQNHQSFFYQQPLFQNHSKDISFF